MNPDTIDGGDEIDKIVRNVLKGSKAWGKFPTPVDQIVSYAELQVANGVDLSKVEQGFFTKQLHVLQRAVSKVLAAIDLREKTIYLDLSQKPERQRFNKLHETGHKALTWQRDVYVRLDDEHTLDPDTDDLFEKQASWFASGALFQLERLEDEAAKLPLTIKSPLALAKTFGGSRHACLRRYVEKSKKRCALLVLNPPQRNGEYAAGIRNYFQSPSFTGEFGVIQWPSKCGLDFQFVKEFKFGARLHEKGQIALVTAGGEFVTFDYHYFNSSYNIFVLLLPRGEKIRSRTVIVAR
jgi:IrrE N-terminal-like domain